MMRFGWKKRGRGENLARAQQVRDMLGSRSIVMVGLMGCGKSSIGRRLAAALGLPFVDADDEIERAALKSIPEIFADHGEAYFCEGERKVIKRLLANGPQVFHVFPKAVRRRSGAGDHPLLMGKLDHHLDVATVFAETLMVWLGEHVPRCALGLSRAASPSRRRRSRRIWSGGRSRALPGEGRGPSGAEG